MGVCTLCIEPGYLISINYTNTKKETIAMLIQILANTDSQSTISGHLFEIIVVAESSSDRNLPETHQVSPKHVDFLLKLVTSLASLSKQIASGNLRGVSHEEGKLTCKKKTS